MISTGNNYQIVVRCIFRDLPPKMTVNLHIICIKQNANLNFCHSVFSYCPLLQLHDPKLVIKPYNWKKKKNTEIVATSRNIK